MASKRPRLECPGCGQNLSYSAYCRHQQLHNAASDVDSETDSDSSFSGELMATTSTSGDSLDNSDDGSYIGDGSCDQNLENQDDTYKAVHDAHSSDEEESDSESAMEIWESDSDSSDACNSDDNVTSTVAQQCREIHFMIAFFVLFFQLCYHISDRGIHYLITFLGTIFKWLSIVVKGSTLLPTLAAEFPRTLYSLRKTLQLTTPLQRFVVCPTCHKLFKEDQCVIVSGGIKISRKCDNIQFPNHPHLSRRVECKTALMKQVKVGKQFKLIPRKYFVYNSIASSLTRLMSRPGFLEQCEAWRKRGCDENFMTDVYDGKIWKDWQKVSGVPYLEVPGNLMLNVDWFRRFKHTSYSAGVIYLVVFEGPSLCFTDSSHLSRYVRKSSSNH